jgi:energy-coupling factor transporter ATP-binding protein EcfA2
MVRYTHISSPVQAPGLVVLAEGRDAKATAEARGRTFEDFFARLLQVFGFEDPRREDLRVVRDGIEIDVTATHTLTRRRAVAELKAYSAPVPVSHLKQFAGAFAAENSDDIDAFFVAAPHLTADGIAFAKRLSAKYHNFKYLGSGDIVKLLQDAGELPSPTDLDLHADLTAVVTPHGLALAARALDVQTRRPVSISCWTTAGPPSEALLKLLRESNFASGLPVRPPDRAAVASLVPCGPEAPRVVTVRGSEDDFEYQFPASPQFFVGREPILDELLEKLSAPTARSQVLVINAQSGWGKSSLALKLAGAVEERKGVALVVDSRSIDRPEFLAAALEQAARRAVDRGLLELPERSAFTGPSSALDTLTRATWASDRGRLLIFFDQFENVFRSSELTRAFRDLALMTAETNLPLALGFAWKTDLVGWTEDHPYALRDDIRAMARVAVLEPFSPSEVRTLLRRLERRLGTPLSGELRTRLTEYSQGLPWLLKKLLGHALTQIHRRSVTQEQLLAQDLNVHALFESDLAGLTAQERVALRLIARSAPVPVIELEGVVSQEVLRGLIHQRLAVQVGERIDVYWDIFRDFLTTGRVAIDDSYVLRQGPAAVGRLLRAAIEAGGDLTIAEAAARLKTTQMVVHNYWRELRMLRVADDAPGVIRIDRQILDAPDRETAVRHRVSSGLRRHKIYGLVMRLIDDHGGRLAMVDLASQLRQAFPTVEAKDSSWLSYARVFSQWLAYGGLVLQERDTDICLPRDENIEHRRLRLTEGKASPSKLKRVFPGASCGPAIKLIQTLGDEPSNLSDNARRSATRDLLVLGVVERGDEETLVLAARDVLSTDRQIDTKVLRRLVEQQPGCAAALAALEADPELDPAAVGGILRDACRAAWTEHTTVGVGKAMRSWARGCGVATSARALPPQAGSDQESLFS